MTEHTTDRTVLHHIADLVAEEKKLYAKNGVSDDEKARLNKINVELDVDLVETCLLIVRHAVLGVEFLLLGDEVRDVVKHGPVGRVLGHDVSPLSEGNQRKIGNATFAQTICGHERALATAATEDNAPRRWRLRDDLLDMVDVKP